MDQPPVNKSQLWRKGLARCPFDWGAETPELSGELLAALNAGELATLSRGARLKVLSAILAARPRDRQRLRAEIDKLLGSAMSDSDQWTQITAAIVASRLQSGGKDLDSRTLDASARDAHLRLQHACQTACQAGGSARFSLPPDLFPSEWAFVSHSLLPSGFSIEGTDTNVHFKPRVTLSLATSTGGAAPSGSRSSAVTASGNGQGPPCVERGIGATSRTRPTSAKTVGSKRSAVSHGEKGAALKKRASMKMVDYDEVEKLRAEQQEKDAVRRKLLKEKVQQTSKAPANASNASSDKKTVPIQSATNGSASSTAASSGSGMVSDVMRLIGNAPKLTAQGRAEIELFLRNDGGPRGKDAPNERSFLLTEKREYIQNRTVIAVERVFLKLTHDPRRWAKVRKRQCFKNPNL